MFKFWLAAYLVLFTAIIGGMFAYRARVLSDMNTPAAEAEWNRWRAEAANENGTTGPVQRTVPKSNEPPLLILMRDYFMASLVGLLLPLSALYWFIAWLARGVVSQASAKPDENPTATRS